jgi:hypothetical protein
MRRRHVAALFPALTVAVGLAGGARSATAQNTDADCAAQLASQFGVDGGDCFSLATALQADRTDAALLGAMQSSITGIDAVASPRDVQSRNGEAPATGGSVADAEAVASVQPVAAAAGSVAAVGSDAGASAITSMTVNPAVFFGGMSDPDVADARSRITDLTVFFPIDELDADDDGSLDYFGFRLRLNALPALPNRDLTEDAARALSDIVASDVEVAELLEGVLRAAPDLAACVLLLGGDEPAPGALEDACGSVVAPSADQELVNRFQARLAELRAAIDAEYFGLDVRLDFGDPTLGEVPGARGTRIYAGLAYGRRFLPSDVRESSYGVRARLGVRSVSLDDDALTDDIDSDFQLEAGLGFEVVYPAGFKPVRLTAGLEGRFGDPPDPALEEALEANAVVVRGALTVPVTEATGVTLSFGAPLWGEVTPTLSVSANWSLLLSSVIPGSGS